MSASSGLGVLMVRVNGQWKEAVPKGPPGPTGPQGAAGPTGPSGQDGQATLIVGDFGATRTPADLPPSGLIPIDWDAPGNPAQPIQLIVGHSMYYDAANTADPLAGHLFQYVTTTADPTGYIDIGLIRGPQGVQGIDGATGPVGPQGLPSEDVYVGPDDPTVPKPTAELWFDTDDTRTLGPHDLPNGGLTGQALVKQSDLDGDIAWSSGVHSGEVFRKTLIGPFNGTAANCTYTVTLESRRYLVMFAASAIGNNAVGARWYALSMDGGPALEYTRLWFNELAVHHQMSTATVVVDVAAGSHTFAIGLTNSGNISSDTNDYGFIVLLPLPLV